MDSGDVLEVAGAGCQLKQDRRVISRSMDDVQDVDSHDRVSDGAVEDLIAAVYAMPNAEVFVPRHQRKPQGCVCETAAFVAQFGDERHSPHGIILGNVIAYGLKIGFGIG